MTVTTHSRDSDAGWHPGAGGPVNVTPLAAAVGSAVGSDVGGGVGVVSVDDDDVGSPLVGSVMARSHATAKPKKKRSTRSRLGSAIDVYWGKARANS